MTACVVLDCAALLGEHQRLQSNLAALMCGRAAPCGVSPTTALLSTHAHLEANERELRAAAQFGDTGIKTGYTFWEVAKPYYMFKEAGLQIHFASPKGGVPPKAPLGAKCGPLCEKFNNDPEAQYLLRNSIPLRDVDPSQYGTVFFCGGMGTMWDYPTDPDIPRIVNTIHGKGGIVSAVCHGPSALVNVRNEYGTYFVKGLRVNSFTNAEEDIAHFTKILPFLLESKFIEHGAHFERGAPMAMHAVTDHRVVTGQNPASAKAVAQRVIEALGIPA